MLTQAELSRYGRQLVLPEVGSQVVVVFEMGNLRRPYILGAAWNGRESLPHDPEAPRILGLVQLTVNGVAAGLQSTG